MASDRFVMSARQAAELDHALERNAWSPEDVKWLSGGSVLADIRNVRIGQAEIRPVGQSGIPLWLPIGVGKTQILVNLAATPRLPFSGATVEAHLGEGWVLVEKKKNNLFVGGKKIILHLSQRQKGGSLTGHELREELTGKPVLNANLLDALYENTHLIPEDWKKDERGNTRYIYFWGTVYRDPADGDLYVRFLCFSDGAWSRHYDWLDYGWYSNYPAALLAS